MKRSHKILGLMLTSSLLLGAAGAAFAYGSGHLGKGGCDAHRAAPMKALHRLENISPEQRQQINTIMEAESQALREQKQAMRDSRRELREAMNGNVDQETLRTLAEKQGEQVTAMIMARAEMRGKIHAVLTEEQRAQMQQMHQQRTGSRHHY